MEIPEKGVPAPPIIGKAGTPAPDIIAAILRRLEELDKRRVYLADLAEDRGLCSRKMVYNFLERKNRIPWETACRMAGLVGLEIEIKPYVKPKQRQRPIRVIAPPLPADTTGATDATGADVKGAWGATGEEGAGA